MKGALLGMLLFLAAHPTSAAEPSRYTFGGAPEQGTFVLDTQTGRVWRYDRVDDAWYLYDLEALVRSPRGESPGRSTRGDGERDTSGREKRPEE